MIVYADRYTPALEEVHVINREYETGIDAIRSEIIDTQLEISRTMAGKTEEEKEIIAASLLKKYEKMAPTSNGDPPTG